MIRQILKKITGIFDDSDPNPLEAIKKKLGELEKVDISTNTRDSKCDFRPPGNGNKPTKCMPCT